MHFSYKAIDKGGKRVTGDIDAESQKAAANRLRAQSLLPVELKAGKAESKPKIDVKNIFGHVPLVDKIAFIKNLAVMLKSGFPVSRAISVLSQQSTNTTLSYALEDISAQVEAGQPLAASMEKHPKIFPPMVTSVVHVGEISGNMEESLLSLAEQLKKDHDLIRKTRGAMIYPSIVLSAMVLVGILMFTFVLPKLTKMFEEFDIELPLITRIIIAAVEFMKSYGILILIFFVVAIAGVIFSFKHPKVKKIADGWVLKIPIVGKLVKYTNLARLSRILSSLIKSGMPILESVKVTGQSLGNTKYKEAVEKTEKMVRSGTSMSASLEKYPELFTPLVLSMIVVGEESGTVNTVLDEVAAFYEAEVDQAVSNMSSTLEPVLMVIVGAAVGVLAMGLIMPIYSITQSTL